MSQEGGSETPLQLKSRVDVGGNVHLPHLPGHNWLKTGSRQSISSQPTGSGTPKHPFVGFVVGANDGTAEGSKDGLTVGTAVGDGVHNAEQ